MNITAIGKRIQKYRQEKGLIQEQFAEKIDISANHLSTLERGMYNIKLETLVRIMNELECSADEIFCDVVHKSTDVIGTRLSEQLNRLPTEEQHRIYEVVEILIRNAK